MSIAARGNEKHQEDEQRSSPSPWPSRHSLVGGRGKRSRVLIRAGGGASHARKLKQNSAKDNISNWETNHKPGAIAERRDTRGRRGGRSGCKTEATARTDGARK